MLAGKGKKKAGRRKLPAGPVAFAFWVALYYVSVIPNVVVASKALLVPSYPRPPWAGGVAAIVALMGLFLPLRPRIRGLDRRCRYGFPGALLGYGLGLVLDPLAGRLGLPAPMSPGLPFYLSALLAILAIFYARWRIEKRKGGKGKAAKMLGYWVNVAVDVSAIIALLWGASFVRASRTESARHAAERRRELAACVIEGDLERLKAMVDEDPGLLDGDGLRSATLAAASAGKREVLDYLVGRGAEIDVFVAARLGDVELLDAKLDEDGAALEATDPGGYTPLMLAARYDRLEAAKTLCGRGADLYREGPDGFAVHVAILADSLAVLDFLATKYDLSRSTRQKETALFFAIVRDKREAAAILLARGADANARDGAAGTGPLHFAARKGRADVAEFLLAHGADVKAVDEAGLTPLHLAAREGSVEVARLLLDRGADPKATDRLGRTPLAVAGGGVKKEIAGMLREAGGR